MTVDEMSKALLETKNIKEPNSLSHGGDRVLIVKFDSDHRRSKSWGSYYDRKGNRSQSRSWKDVECTTVIRRDILEENVMS